MWQTSNPALTRPEDLLRDGRIDAASDRASLSGVVNKTGLLALIAVVFGGVGYMLVPSIPWLPIAAVVASFAIMLVAGFAIRSNPAMAPKVAWLYAVVEGVLLGSITAVLDARLAALPALEAVVAEKGGTGLALPAFVVTACALLAMLGLWRIGVRPTAMFTRIVVTGTVAVCLVYLVAFVMSLFGVAMPFLSLGSALQGGTAAWIGIGLNVLILGLASSWLIIDFGTVEDLVASGAPKTMEWYGAFALMTTLCWIYYEALKLVFRLAILLGNRD